MTTLVIEGKKVTVSDDFLTLSPAEQEATVEEIATSLGVMPASPTSGFTPDEESVVDSPMKGYSDRDLRIIAETGIDNPMSEPVNRGPRAIGSNPGAPKRDVMGELSDAFQSGLKESDAEAAARRSTEARAKADATAEIARRATENAKPNMAEDMLMGAGSGVMNAITGTGAIIAGAPGSISNAINAPDLEEFKRKYPTRMFKDATDEDVIWFYNKEQAKAGLPSYEDQLSSMPTITDSLNWTRDNITKGTVGEYRPQTLPGQVAETAGGLAAFGGVGGTGAQVATRLTGAAIGAETADQLTKDVENPWVRGGAQITGAVLGGGVGGLVTGIDDAARAASLRGSLEQTRVAARDAATRAAGLRQNFNALIAGNDSRLAQIMSVARVYTGLGRDQSLVSASNLARTALSRGPLALGTGGLSEAATFALGVGGRMMSAAKANPVVQQTVLSGARTAPASSGVMITSQGGQVTQEPSDIVPLTAQ